MKPFSHHRGLRLIMGVVFAGALIGLAEIAARLNGVQPSYQHDGLGQWRVTPNLDDQVFAGANDSHHFRVSTNDDGFRTQAVRAEKGAYTRIALMGDSTVFGWGVDGPDSLPAVAQASLNDQGFSRVQVINFGQPGYSTAMMGSLFRDAVAAYQPDLSIVFIPMHDYNLSLVSDLEFLQGASTTRAFIRSLLVQHVALYELIRRRVYPFANEMQLLPHQQGQEARVERVSKTERYKILHQIQRVASEWGGEISVGFLPFYADLQHGSGAGQHHSGAASLHLFRRPGVESLESWSFENNRPMFDLRDCCAHGAADRTFPFDHTHLNSLGNREVGLALAETIVASLGLKPEGD